MKLRYYLSALAIAALAMVGCTEKEEPLDPSLEISKTSISFTKDGGTETITMTSTLDWALKDYTDDVKSWLVIDPSSGKGSANSVTVSIKASANDGVDRSASITFFGNVLQKQTVTITQEGSKGDIETLTVKEFLTRKDTETEYKVTGKVGVISNSTSYYGCYLKDDTGELCVAFPTNWKDYSSTISTGGTATVKGKYSYYESKQQDQMANGEILEFTAPASSAIQTLTVADFLSKKDQYSVYRLTGTVNSKVEEKYCSFDLKDDSGTVKVYTVNNASEWGSKVKQYGKVTLRGAYTLYNSTPEVVDAWIESFEEGTDPTPTASVEGVVAAVSSKAFIVLDADKKANYVFADAKPEVEIGDKVKVEGKSTTYNDLPQISEPVVTKVSSGNKVDYPALTVLDGKALDAYSTAFGYVKFTGDLTKSGDYYNLKVADATRKGSISYAVDIPSELVGKTVDVTGFFVGISGSIYFNVITTEVKLSENQTPVETLAHPLVSTVTWKLGTAAYDNTSSGNSKQSATVNGTAVDNLLKLGSSSKAGDATLTIPSGKTKIGFYAAGWWPTQKEQESGITTETKITLTIGDKTVDVARAEGATGNPAYTLSLTDAKNYYEVEVPSGEVKISSQNKSGYYRVAIIGITAY